MGLFRSKKSRQVISDPVPDWDDTRWRSHLRSNALGTEHHCSMYLEMINADRKEAARTFQNDDEIRARSVTESAIRNKRIVTALTALAPISSSLYQRSEPLGGYTSLVQIPEPARSGIVTIVYAAGRLPMSYLTDIVSFLREQFGSVHIDQIQQGRGELDTLVNSTVREALTPGPASQADVDQELASAVKEYFGVSITPSLTHSINAGPSGSFVSPATDVSHQSPAPLPAQSQTSSEIRRAQTTPLSPSFKSSDVPDPSSPHILSDYSRNLPSRPLPSYDSVLLSPSLPPAPTPPLSSAALSPHGAMFTPTSDQKPSTAPLHTSVHMPSSPPQSDLMHAIGNTVDIGSMKRSRGSSVVSPEQTKQLPSREAFASMTSASATIPLARVTSRTREQDSTRLLPRRLGDGNRIIPDHLAAFSDSDEMLLARYEHLRQVLTV